MFNKFLLLIVLMLANGTTVFAKSEPFWKNGDDQCPAPSATDKYIDVPVFHDLESNAEIARIPGLNVFKANQTEYKNKKIRVYYELLNGWDPKKPLVILVPGGPGQPHADLHPLVEPYEKETDLVSRFNIIAMDHRGVGCSRPVFPGNEPTESMMMRQAASDIDAIRRELVGPEGKINVWGYSYGSILAQTYALLFPKNLNRLFLGGTVSELDDWHMAALQLEALIFSAVDAAKRQQFLEATKDVENLRDAFIAWGFLQLYGYEGRVREIPKKLDEVLNLLKLGDSKKVLEDLYPGSDVMPWMQRSILCMELFPFTTKYPGETKIWAESMTSCSEYKGKYEYFNYLPLLKQIDAPTLIYGGAFDHVTPPKAMIKMAQQIKGSYLFIDNYLGHGFGGKTGCFIKLTAEFFAGADNAALERIAYSDLCQSAPVIKEKK